jgi:hypothetical protein
MTDFPLDDPEDLDAKLDRMQADGRIDSTDAEEVRRFGEFLADVGQYPREATKARAQVYFQHYPEHRPPEEDGDPR